MLSNKVKHVLQLCTDACYNGNTETRKESTALTSARRTRPLIMPDGPWPRVPQHDLSHSNMSACRRRPLPALHLIASFIPWTKVSPPLITCPSVGYFERYSEKKRGLWRVRHPVYSIFLNYTSW